jgi:methyl-accepting chemotaxis protein
MDLGSAIAKHAEWKVKFRSAIGKQEQIDATTLSKDNCCELGKWLHGEGKSKYGKFASLGVCTQKHAAFHVEAGKVASAINAKKFTEAGAMLDGGTAYARASSDVGVAIMKVRKETGL